MIQNHPNDISRIPRTSDFYKIINLQEHAFIYIHNVMADDMYTDLERDEVKEASLNNLQVRYKCNTVPTILHHAIQCNLVQ